MIDPANVHLYDAKLQIKEEFLLFAICVAGKKATVIAKKIDEFLQDIYFSHAYCNEITILDLLSEMNFEEIDYYCKKWKLGKYTIIPKCLYELSRSGIDIENCTTDQLEKFPGIGPKTSRYFIMYTQRNKEFAALDTHILKWLKERGYKVPKSTPDRKRYSKIEQYYLDECKKLNRNPTDLDLELWKKYSGN